MKNKISTWNFTRSDLFRLTIEFNLVIQKTLFEQTGKINEEVAVSLRYDIYDLKCVNFVSYNCLID